MLNHCTLKQAESVAESLRQLVQDFCFEWQEKVFKIGVSIGLVEVNCDSENLSVVLSAADAACYAAKRRGRNCIYVFQAGDQELEHRQTERQWIARLDQALEENRFCLYSQKIVSALASPEVEHREILVRLVDELGKLVSPIEFIPAAERYQLMPAVDRWVVETFFAQYQAHRQRIENDNQSFNPEIYTINLSGSSLNYNFQEFLKQKLAEYQVTPQCICFEITETAAIANLNQATHFIQTLKQLGCQFALDDFGSGLSSLTYLKNLPVDYLKIDGSFVKNMDNDQMDYAMVECFNSLSHYMGIKTITEWVENDAVLNILQRIGVDFVQGYFIDRPNPLVFC